MEHTSVYRDRFIDLEWKDRHDKDRYLHAYRNLDAKLDDVPLMFVGVGGTGIDAVLTLKGRIETIYNPKEADRIEYLLIDTDKIGSGRSIDPADTIVVQSSDTAMLLREAQRNTNRNHFISDEIRSWLDSSISPFRVMNGAAGIRQAGRLILFLNFQKIYDALQRKIRKISKRFDGSICRPKVFLFTGIGGGTGSGMFVDLSYLIRTIQNVDLQGVVFMPDVSCLKPNLREIHKKNIQRNGFAALKELDYLMSLDRFQERFSQDYPGGTHVDMSYPIFDLCILVGAQEDGRKPVNSEQEVFEKTAEYILFEIQGKISEFGMGSYKSNLANKLPNEPFCDRYAAIGAAASYVPVDYYYSWWLRDVLRHFSLNGDSDEKLDATEIGFVEMEEDVRREIKSAPYRPLRCYTHAQEHMKNNMEGKIKSGKMLPSYFFLLFNENYTTAVDKISSIISRVSLKGIKREHTLQKILLRKRRLQKKYKNAYIISFGKRIRTLEEQSKNNCEMLKRIIEQMGDYDIAKVPKLSEQFMFGKSEFEQIRQGDNYKKSTRAAAKKLADDMYQNPSRWGGLSSGLPQWLSDYIAKLLWNLFCKSGCLDLELLIKYASINGYNGQEVYLHGLLSGLDARQLWPKSPYTSSDDYHRMLAGPETNPIKGWIENWLSINGKDDIFCANPVNWRFARAVLVPGNALFAYHGIRDLEISYMAAPNKAGLHLYASGDKDWSELPSPYFETKWVDGDATKRSAEKERNKHYRDVFDEAFDKEIIVKKEDGFYYIKKHEELIRIGDIAGDEAMAKDMFIHMFEHRKWVEQEIK